MDFWIFAALFVAIVTLLVLWQVTRFVDTKKSATVSDMSNFAKSDVAFYKKQLQEIDSEYKAGFIDEDSTKEAKLEIARNVLALENQHNTTKIQYQKRSLVMRLILSFAIICIPAFTLGLYGLIGNPNSASYPFQTLLAKPSEQRTELEKLVALEALFMRNPNNGQLADNLASQYLITGRFQKAVNSYIDALRLNGENAPRLVGYGLALKGLEGGVITKDAQAAFEQAAKIAPKDYYPQIYKAEALQQAGETEKAIQGLQIFLQNAPKNSPQNLRLQQRLENMIEQLQKDAKLPNKAEE